MQGLRTHSYITTLGIGLSALILIIFASSRVDREVFGLPVQDFQFIIILLLSFSLVCAVVFLSSSRRIDQVFRQEEESTLKAVRTQLLIGIAEIRELKEEIREMILAREGTSGEHPLEGGPAQRIIEISPVSSATSRTDNGEHLHLSRRLGSVNNELVNTYQVLAEACIPHDLVKAKQCLSRALEISADPVVTAEIHYALCCILARQGHVTESVRELEIALATKSPTLGQNLAKDTEQGGPLYDLANREPYEKVLDEMLMNISVGAS